MNGGLQANHLSISGILAQEGIVFPSALKDGIFHACSKRNRPEQSEHATRLLTSGGRFLFLTLT